MNKKKCISHCEKKQEMLVNSPLKSLTSFRILSLTSSYGAALPWVNTHCTGGDSGFGSAGSHGSVHVCGVTFGSWGGWVRGLLGAPDLPAPAKGTYL